METMAMMTVVMKMMTKLVLTTGHYYGPPRQSDPGDGYRGRADDDDVLTGFILSISRSGMSHLILKEIGIHTFEFSGFL